MILGPNRVIAKDVKNCTYCCYVRCIIRVGVIPCPQKGATELYAQLGLPDKRLYKNQRVDCLLCSMARIHELLDGSLDKRKLRGLVLCCGQDGYGAQVPQHPINTYIQIHT